MIRKTFETIKDLGFKNLVVSGCSFTYNNSYEHIVTWPYYLRDFGGFDRVIDCGMPGAGNYHIMNSMIWTLENENINKDETLIIIMWSGFSRDDCIMDSKQKTNYSFKFNYNKYVSTGISGGSSDKSRGNTDSAFKGIQRIKSAKSRAIENFLYITALYNYLENKKFKFIFLDFLDYKLPNRSDEFNPMDYIPENLQKNYKQMFFPIENIYKFALTNNLLEDDDFHPSPNGHMQWTKQQLLPRLIDLFGL